MGCWCHGRGMARSASGGMVPSSTWCGGYATAEANGRRWRSASARDSRSPASNTRRGFDPANTSPGTWASAKRTARTTGRMTPWRLVVIVALASHPVVVEMSEDGRVGAGKLFQVDRAGGRRPEIRPLLIQDEVAAAHNPRHRRERLRRSERAGAHDRVRFRHAEQQGGLIRAGFGQLRAQADHLNVGLDGEKGRLDAGLLQALNRQHDLDE